jgi:hypothetical protein
MNERVTLLATLDRLFAGPRDSVLTIAAFLNGLEARSYAFAVAALDLPNCIPTGIPWLSTVTGVPMALLAAQHFLRRPSPSLPAFIGRQGLSRGRLQDFLSRARPHIERLENAVHPRREWWVTGLLRRALQATWVLMIVILALPIPFDNFFAAWAVLFFCLALIEGDGVMAILGWLLAVTTLAWTALLLIVGPLVVIGLIKSVF